MATEKHSSPRCPHGGAIPYLVAAMVMGVITGLPSAALAQNASTLESVALYPNISAAGITATISGDDNGDASVSVSYRLVGSGTWWPGHPLLRVPGGRFLGSLFYLDPDTEYEVEVVLADPDNGAPLSMTETVITRRDAPPAPTGGHLWVDALLGDDGNPGTQTSPLASIGAAAALAQAGDTVHILPGVYYEALVLPRGGTSGQPILYKGEGAGVVLSGAEPDLAEGNAVWTHEGDGIYWTAFSGEAFDYLAVEDRRIYDYQSLADLQAENGKTGTPGALAGGYFVDTGSQRLYLRLPDRTSPVGRPVYAAVRGRGVLLDTMTDVVIQGLEIRHFSEVGVDIRDSRRIWVRGCHLHHLNAGVRVRRSQSWENVVEDCRMRDTSVYGWPWASCKGQTCEQSGVAIVGGEGNVVRRNVIDGFFNGVYTGAFGVSDEAIARNTDVWENTILRTGDDGLEPEGAGVNHRFVENIIVDVYNAVSLAPIEVGPTWLVRTVVVGYTSHVLKLNNGSVGHMRVYHTTSLPHPAALGAQAFAPSIPFGGLVTRNNLFTGNRYVIEYGNTTLAGPVDLDFDNLYSLDLEGAGRFVKWLDQRYDDLLAFRAGTSLEAHGHQVEPLYEDPGSGDFTLVESSPLLDVGEVIPGINDRLHVDGPDLGAFERGGIIPGPGDAGVPWPDGGSPWADAGPGPGSDGTLPGADGSGPGPGADGSGPGADPSGGRGCGCQAGGPGGGGRGSGGGGVGCVGVDGGGSGGGATFLLLALLFLGRLARRGRPE